MVICNRLKSDSFCYDLDPYNTEMWIHNRDDKCKEEPSVIKIMFSKTLFPLYLPIFASVILILINSFMNWF